MTVTLNVNLFKLYLKNIFNFAKKKKIFEVLIRPIYASFTFFLKYIYITF